jgi:hypothetical protein
MLFVAINMGIRGWGSYSEGSGSQTNGNDRFERDHVDKNLILLHAYFTMVLI